jgi:hypothetical protein
MRFCYYNVFFVFYDFLLTAFLGGRLPPIDIFYFSMVLNLYIHILKNICKYLCMRHFI